jgi:hypothetical protein
MSPGYAAQNGTPAPIQEYQAHDYSGGAQAPAPFAPAQDYGAASAFAPAPPPQQQQQAAPAAPAADPALFTMSGLSGQVEAPAPSDPNVSLADQAYAKYASMAEFDLVSKSEPL